MKVSFITALNYVWIRAFIQRKWIKAHIQESINGFMPDRSVAIAIATNENFIMQACVMVRSLENIKCNVLLYLLTVTLSKENVEKIRTAAPSNVNVIEVPIEEVVLRKLKISAKWPIEAWARIMIPELIPEKQVLYLDVDTVVVEDISDVFSQYKDLVICGVKSTFYAFHGMKDRMPYAINSGVLLLNCEKLKKFEFTKKVIDYACTHYDELKMPDQDSINYVCRQIMVDLPPCYNAMNYFFSKNHKEISRLNGGPYYLECEYNQAKKRPKIIHYNGGPLKRPWQKGEMKHPYWRIYQSYLDKLG